MIRLLAETEIKVLVETISIGEGTCGTWGTLPGGVTLHVVRPRVLGLVRSPPQNVPYMP